MQTLILDTSGPYSTVAVLEGRSILGASAVRGRPAARIHAQIDRMLHETGVVLSGLHGIAVVSGPGSWTGLNIGMTAAKTLAQVLALPVLPISSLDALVACCRWREGPVCALLSAGRDRVYRAWYRTGMDGAVDLDTQSAAITEFETAEEEIFIAEGMPLVIEYGNRVGTMILAPCVISQTGILSPEGMAAVAARTRPVPTAEALMLTPMYMQQSMVERDAAP